MIEEGEGKRGRVRGEKKRAEGRKSKKNIRRGDQEEGLARDRGMGRDKEKCERKREEEIKRAGRSDSVMKSVSRHYFTHTDLIPRR